MCDRTDVPPSSVGCSMLNRSALSCGANRCSTRRPFVVQRSSSSCPITFKVGGGNTCSDGTLIGSAEYTGRICVDCGVPLRMQGGNVEIDLAKVGQNVRVTFNGQDLIDRLNECISP